MHYSESRDASNRLNCSLGACKSQSAFMRRAKALCRAYKGKVVGVVSDLDSTYIDVEIAGQMLTFHHHDIINRFEIISPTAKTDALARRIGLMPKPSLMGIFLPPPVPPLGVLIPAMSATPHLALHVTQIWVKPRLPKGMSVIAVARFDVTIIAFKTANAGFFTIGFEKAPKPDSDPGENLAALTWQTNGYTCTLGAYCPDENEPDSTNNGFKVEIPPLKKGQELEFTFSLAWKKKTTEDDLSTWFAADSALTA